MKNYAVKAQNDLNAQKLKFLSRFLDRAYHSDPNLTGNYLRDLRHSWNLATRTTIFQKDSSFPGGMREG